MDRRDRLIDRHHRAKGRRGDRSTARAIVDGSGDAIFGTTNDGIVTSWNRAAEDLFGYTSEEMIGRPIEVIATAGERESEQSGMRERLGAGGAAEHLETVRTRKDGSTVDVLITASSSHDESGTMVGLSVITQDITVRLTAQRALEASRRRLAEAQRTAQIGSFEFDVLSGTAWSEEDFASWESLSIRLRPPIRSSRWCTPPMSIPSSLRGAAQSDRETHRHRVPHRSI